MALQEEDSKTLSLTAGTIRGRAARLANIVTAEMSFYETGFGYVERVTEAVKVLRNTGKILEKCLVLFHSLIHLNREGAS